MVSLLVLAGRIPVQLNSRQALLIAILVAGLLVALLVAGVFEAAVSGAVSLILRLAGRPSQRKSSVGRALDELESRLQETRKPPPP